MKLPLILFCALLPAVSFAKTAAEDKKPLFSDTKIDEFAQKIKKDSKIPTHALDMLFDFYKKNRASTGGLQDTSCIDKKEYKIRNKDPKLTKAALKLGIENEECLCIIDYTLGKTNERGHCIFLSAGADPEIENFLVAHGSGSKEENGCPTKFTNALTSTGTTLSGFFLTSADTYTFQGHAAGVGGYASTGLSLYGVENSNWTAANVGKATHGAPYVTAGPKKNIGRSLGCPAMAMEQAKKMLPRCTGKAAWLNYTFDSKNKSELIAISCK